MRKTRRVGLRTLFLKQGINLDTLTETDLTFTVAPRLNAASRMDTPYLAFELLSTDDESRASVLVDTLESINAERKTLVARIVKAAHSTLEQRELPPIVVVGNPEWRPAVLGLVANKLQETYQRSFFVWGEAGDGILKGSCRVQTEHHAALLLHSLPEGILIHAGGHQAAGGFAVNREHIHTLEIELNKAAAIIGVQESEQKTRTPIVVPLAVVTPRHRYSIRQCAPFGVGNPEPQLCFQGVVIASAKMFGKTKEHIEIIVRDMTGIATAFAFFASDSMTTLCQVGNTIDIIGTIDAGWRGGVRIRITEINTVQ